MRSFLVGFCLLLSFSASVAHADEDDLGMSVLSCFHPTGKYDRIKLSEERPVSGHVGADGRIFFRGGWSGNTYYMKFLMEVRKVEGKSEFRITPGEDTAPFPPNPNCRLRSWTEVGH